MLSVKQKEQENSFPGNNNDLGCSGLFAGYHCLLSYTSNKDWILDNGASDHMGHDLTLFDNFSELTKENNYITILMETDRL